MKPRLTLIQTVRCLLASLVIAMGLVMLVGSGSGGSNGYPIHLSVSVPSPGYVSLEWTIWENNPYEDYDILRDGYLRGISDYFCNYNGCSAIDISVAPNARYCYQIVVQDELFLYAESNEACITTQGLAGWAIETIDNGSNPALSLDSSNQPHVSYRNDTGVFLSYKSGTNWQQSIVDSEVGDSGDTGVVVDSVNADHVSYLDDTNDLLMYASNSTGVWQAETIDTSVGEVNALSIDNTGSAHIVYKILVTDLGVVGYATNAAGSWQTERLVEFPSESIRDADILVDATGAVHLVFTSRNYGTRVCAVHYMTNEDGTWQREVVDDYEHCGVAMAMDTAGGVHVVYVSRLESYYDAVLMHADNSGGSWQFEQIDSLLSHRYPEVDLAIDGANSLHIAYQDKYRSLKYATNVNGVLEFSFLDSSGSGIFIDPSITIDPTGQVKIVYVYSDLYYYTDSIKLATSP